MQLFGDNFRHGAISAARRKRKPQCRASVGKILKVSFVNLEEWMMELPERKTNDMLKGRMSVPFANYFVTLCIKQRKSGLTATQVGAVVKNTLRKHQQSHDIHLYCATIMPDHIHLLFQLQERLTLSQVIGKFKSATNESLKISGLTWQDNFYDHRIRTGKNRAGKLKEPLENFSFYIYKNPYLKSLIDINAVWPWWIKHRDYNPLFLAEADLQPELFQSLLKKPQSIAEIINENRV